MRVGGVGHFTQTKVESFCEQHIQKTNSVFAGCPGAEMSKSIREACGLFHIQQHVCNPHIRQTAVEIENKFIGFNRDGGGQAVNF